MDALADSLKRSPEWFPYALNTGLDTLAFIRLSRRDYDNASFLDARILTPLTTRSWAAWRDVAAAVETAALAERCHFIFHIGHVGSTLLSRLLGAHPGAFALREPQLLRSFAQLRNHFEAWPPGWSEAQLSERVDGSLKLLSRTFERQQVAVVKATSFVSELAGELLGRAAGPRALMMYVSPENYLATILGGPNSRQEAKVLAPSRLLRLHRRMGQEMWPLQSFSEGEAIALGWACEAAALAAAARAAGERVLRLDFDRFLADPSACLRAALRHLQIHVTSVEVDQILAGPHMRRYSKDPEHAYDAALRREVLNAARATHAAEIRRGLAWLDRAARDFEPVRAAMAFGTTPT